MVGNFNDRRIVFGNWYSNTLSTTTFLVTDTWNDLNITFSETSLVNNVYGLKFVDHNDVDIPDSEINFSTKGTNDWEVQNQMIIDFNSYNIDENGFGSTNFSIKAMVKNRADTSSLNVTNASLVVVKI